MEDFLTLARNRRSIRAFTPGPLEFEKIVEIIRAATYAPSVGNLQPWSFIVVTDDHVRSAIANECPQQGWMHNSSALIVFVADYQKVKDYYGDGGSAWCTSSCGAAVQNMLLAASDLEVGATWVTSFDVNNVRDLLKIPDGNKPEAIVVLGYADETPSPKTIKPLDQCVYFNGFGNKTEDMSAALKDWGTYVRRHKKVVQEKTAQASKDAKPKLQSATHKAVASLKDVVKKVKKSVEGKK